jgi:hypothetical protein
MTCGGGGPAIITGGCTNGGEYLNAAACCGISLGDEAGGVGGGDMAAIGCPGPGNKYGCADGPRLLTGMNDSLTCIAGDVTWFNLKLSAVGGGGRTEIGSALASAAAAVSFAAS